MDQKRLICNGEFEIVKITEDLHEQAVELYQTYFMKYENLCIATHLQDSQQAIDDMLLLIRSVLSDNISFAARHCETKELVAMSVNKVLEESGECTLEPVFKQFKSPQMYWIGQVLDRMEGTHNIFQEWNVDCTMEIFFLSTRPDFGRRGLAATLSQFSIDYARQLSTLPESENLPAFIKGKQPKAVTSLFSSLFTQKIGQKLGFQTVHEVQNSEFVYKGKTLAESIDPMHKSCVYAALRL